MRGIVFDQLYETLGVKSIFCCRGYGDPFCPNQNQKTGKGLLQNNIVRVNGHDLIKELGFKPGPLMGKAFAALDEKLLDKPDLSREDALAFIKEFSGT